MVKSTNGRLFGGYAQPSWNDGWIKGNGESFLFSIDENTKLVCIDKN